MQTFTVTLTDGGTIPDVSAVNATRAIVHVNRILRGLERSAVRAVRAVLASTGKRYRLETSFAGGIQRYAVVENATGLVVARGVCDQPAQARDICAQWEAAS